MGNFVYKIKPGDTLLIGSETSPRAIFTVDGMQAVESKEDLTTTGVGATDILDPDIAISLVTTGGAHTVTLADGSYDGQIKKVMMVATGGDMTLTPANFADGTSMTFDAVMDSATLRWDGTNWALVAASAIAIV